MRDISVPIRDGMWVYHDNPEVRTELFQAIDRGDTANVTRLDFGVHTATHVDAPRHFFDDGAGAETIDPEALTGPAWVVDATSLTALDAASLARIELPPPGAERVLFKTTNSELWARDSFTRDFLRFDGSGAEALLARGGLRLIGIDYLSVGDPDAHRAFLGNRVVPLEGLDLRGVAPGAHRLVCTALKIEGADGAPARAFLA